MNEQVRQLRDNITHNYSVVNRFLFEQYLAISYIFHLENRVNEKLIMMLVLEGLRKCGSPAAVNYYFEQLTILFKNGVMYEEYGELKLPLSDKKLEPISLSNGNKRKVLKKSVLLFDLVFENHPMRCVRRNMLKYFITDKLLL